MRIAARDQVAHGLIGSRPHVVQDFPERDVGNLPGEVQRHDLDAPANLRDCDEPDCHYDGCEREQDAPRTNRRLHVHWFALLFGTAMLTSREHVS